MKAIYSVYTHPPHREELEGLKGGFLNALDMAASLALSIYYTKKWAKGIEVHMDNWSYNILSPLFPDIDCVKTLNGLDTFSSYFWSAPKLKACELQEDEYIHLDGDVILKKDPKKILRESEISFQSMDYMPAEDYNILSLKIKEQGAPVKNSWIIPDNSPVYNFGIIYDKNNFFKKHNKEILNFTEKYENIILKTYNKYEYRVFPAALIEQGFQSALAATQKTKSYLNHNWSHKEAKERGYIHLMSGKKSLEVMDKVYHRLQDVDPQCLYNLEKFFNNK